MTIRGAKALEIIERGLKVKEYELKKSNFSNTGNLILVLLSTGIHFLHATIFSGMRYIRVPIAIAPNAFHQKVASGSELTSTSILGSSTIRPLVFMACTFSSCCFARADE